jgi:hypothetical protein
MSGNNPITMTLRMKQELERKAKAGWKCFFMMRDDYCDMNESYGTLLFQHRELVKQLKDGKKDVDLTFLINIIYKIAGYSILCSLLAIAVLISIVVVF